MHTVKLPDTAEGKTIKELTTGDVFTYNSETYFKARDRVLVIDTLRTAYFDGVEYVTVIGRISLIEVSNA